MPLPQINRDPKQMREYLATRETYFQPDHWFNRLGPKEEHDLGRAAVALGAPVEVLRDATTRKPVAVEEIDAAGHKHTWGEREAHAVLIEVRHLAAEVVVRSRNRYSGKRIPSMVQTLLGSMIFNVHAYIEGPSGTAKSDVTSWISQALDIPWVRIDATSEKGVLDLLGGEVPSAGGAFIYSLVGALTPGALAVHIDEFPRLLATSSNALLQLLAEGAVSLNLAASGLGNRTVRVYGTFIGTGNPVVGYAGQGERNMATFDRLTAGEVSSLPGFDEYMELLERAQLGGGGKQDEPPIPLKFTFRQARAAMSWVLIHSARNDPNNLMRQLVLASYAISPRDYVRRWTTDDWSQWDLYTRELPRKRQAELEELRRRADDTLLEGSNPRGVLGVAKLARVLAATDYTQAGNPSLTVTPTAMGKAFRIGNFARLKPLPGCEDDVKSLLEDVVQFFFPGTPMDLPA